VEPHDNNAPISGYRVSYMQPAFIMEMRQREENTTSEMITITNLFPGVDYTFIITAFNEIGQSVPSEPLTVRTLDESKSMFS